MRKSNVTRILVAAGAVLLGAGSAVAADVPAHSLRCEHVPFLVAANDTSAGAPAESAAAAKGVTGQGEMQFKIYRTSAIASEAVKAGLAKAHGGFAVDRREGKGDIYFAIPDPGIVHISPDFESATEIPTPEGMKGTNMHNASIFYGEGGTSYLAFPGNESNQLFVTTTEGELMFAMAGPEAGTEFSAPAVTEYFKNGGKFVPTDVEELDGRFYVSTGYSDLDWVLTADLDSSDGVSAAWTPLAFAGRGEGVGQLGTGHGLTIGEDGTTVNVADRKYFEVETYSPDGTYLSTQKLPDESMVCDIDYFDGYTIAGCLRGKDFETIGAPIHLVKDGEIVSTLHIKRDLGIETFQHIHNAVMVERGGKYYILALAWNPGDFVILEQVR